VLSDESRELLGLIFGYTFPVVTLILNIDKIELLGLIFGYTFPVVTLILNIDKIVKIPRNLSGPHLHSQIHASLTTNLSK
jgi:hypothetical protein